jgi:hypothetical protein
MTLTTQEGVIFIEAMRDIARSLASIDDRLKGIGESLDTIKYKEVD